MKISSIAALAIALFQAMPVFALPPGIVANVVCVQFGSSMVACASLSGWRKSMPETSTPSAGEMRLSVSGVLSWGLAGVARVCASLPG